MIRALRLWVFVSSLCSLRKTNMSCAFLKLTVLLCQENWIASWSRWDTWDPGPGTFAWRVDSDVFWNENFRCNATDEVPVGYVSTWVWHFVTLEQTSLQSSKSLRWRLMTAGSATKAMVEHLQSIVGMLRWSWNEARMKLDEAHWNLLRTFFLPVLEQHS